MKNSMMLICAVSLGISLCAGVSASAADEPAFTVDSPFDLTLGSTNYAVRLGKSVRSNTSAWYDPETKVTTTNWSAYGSVRLSAPYHGVKSVHLNFKGEERRLDSYCFDIGEKKHASGGTLSVEECRNVMKEIADDISKRFGVKMEASKHDGGELSDKEIDKSDFMQNVIDAFKMDDKMYVIVPGFTVTGIAGKSKYIGDGKNLSFDKIRKIAADKGLDNSAVFGLTDRDTVFHYAIAFSGDQFIDRNAHTCNFNTDEFRELLEFVKLFPEAINEEQYNDYYTQYLADKALFALIGHEGRHLIVCKKIRIEIQTGRQQFSIYCYQLHAIGYILFFQGI